MSPERRIEEAMLALHASAYRLAAWILGDAHAAEDAVQEAYLRVWRARDRVRDADLRPWLLRVVANTARTWHRGESRRKGREDAVARSGIGAAAMDPTEAVGRKEAAARLRAALDALDERLRLPLLLHHVEGLTHEEAARVLSVSPDVCRKSASRGAERLRRALTASGLALAPAALLQTLAAGARLEAPAGLAGRLGAAMSGTEAAGAGAAVLKGGLGMKILAGLVLAGAVTGGVAVSTGMLGRGGRPLAAEKPRKFSTPVWDPGAQWEKSKEHFAGLGLGGTFSMGELDGPRREVLNRTIGRPRLDSGLSACGRYVYMSYDAKTERFHGVTAGAAGYLDGPFSRARFFGDDYLPRQAFREAPSPDGRYVYLVSEKWGDARLRCLDFVEQTVATLPTGSAPPLNAAVDGKGSVYVVNYNHELLVLDPGNGWKPSATVKLDAQEKLSALSCSLAADEVHGRVYAGTYRSKNWYIWYWDVKDGSFHGVLPMPGKGGPARPGGMGGATPGPFKGTRMYGESTVGFGPDDPEKRFLYAGSIDDPSFYRLDLEKQWFYKFDSNAGRFIGEGANRHPAVTYAVQPTWFEDGSFMGTYKVLWRRVK